MVCVSAAARQRAEPLGRRTAGPVEASGEIVAKALVTDRVSPGLICAIFHFTGPRNANHLTIGALDPVAKIPEYKVCAVKVQ